MSEFTEKVSVASAALREERGEKDVLIVLAGTDEGDGVASHRSCSGKSGIVLDLLGAFLMDHQELIAPLMFGLKARMETSDSEE